MSIKPYPEKPKNLISVWTDLLSSKFSQQIPSCILAFGYHNVIPQKKKGMDNTSIVRPSVNIKTVDSLN